MRKQKLMDVLKEKFNHKQNGCLYPFGSSYPTHPSLKPRYPPTIAMKSKAQTFMVVTMVCANEL